MHVIVGTGGTVPTSRIFLMIIVPDFSKSGGTVPTNWSCILPYGGAVQDVGSILRANKSNSNLLIYFHITCKLLDLSGGILLPNNSTSSFSVTVFNSGSGNKPSSSLKDITSIIILSNILLASTSAPS